MLLSFNNCPYIIIWLCSPQACNNNNNNKSAQVTPIFKKGNRHSPNNYRPISLTSPVVRLFESIVKDEIDDQLNLHHLLCTDQHDFVPGRLCITQMLIAVDYWTIGLEQSRQVLQYSNMTRQTIIQLCSFKLKSIFAKIRLWAKQVKVITTSNGTVTKRGIG